MTKQRQAFDAECRKKFCNRPKACQIRLPHKKKDKNRTESVVVNPIICKSCVNINTLTCEKCPIFKQAYSSKIILK